MMGKLYFEDSGRRFVGIKPFVKAGSRNDFESGSSGHNAIYGRKNSILGNSRQVENCFASKIKSPGSMMKKICGSSGDEAIRLQGKNGVLKVLVNNKKKVNVPLVSQNSMEVGRTSSGAGSRVMTTPKKVMIHYPRLLVKKGVLNGSKSFDASDKDEAKSGKVSPVKSRETDDESSEDSDMPPSKNQRTQVSMSRKRESDGTDTPLPDRLQSQKSKAGNLKRGSGTEKQLLREKIRNILVSAGWTIDYRPRRNRHYCDAVYVNPTGTAYWSIIKAYDAYHKQLEDEGAEDGGGCSSSTPISSDMLSKLTRQTQKKIEKELKRKKRDDARSSKRKKGATAGKLVSDEDDTDGSDTDKLEENLGSRKDIQIEDGKLPSHSNRLPIQGRKSKTISRCTLLVRNSEKGLPSASDGFVPYKGQHNLLSWLIDFGVVELNEKVRYMNHRHSQVMLQGWVRRDGIHCGCCSKILTVSKFEIHASSKLQQPYQNIHLNSGPSLLQCMLDAWNRQDESHRRGFQAVDVDDDLNDDTCGICGDGGDLICCDSCPSTFHQSCLDIEMLPPGDWHCSHCSCKFCGLAEPHAAEGNNLALSSMSLCMLCQRKYHKLCIQEMDAAPVKPINPSISFCGPKCRELYGQLQKFLGIKHELEAGFSWSLIHCTDLEADSSLRGFSHSVEWNAKLAVAQTVMDECFLPITDRRSGINLIHNAIYNCGSNFHRLNFSGFHAAILERGDEIISAASIRIHGTQLAEIPFIGTRHIYRHQGMFRRLFLAIESALRSLKVEKLIIPTISELRDTWTKAFGFSALEESHRKDMKSINMLVFPGTDMLQKRLVEPEAPNPEVAVASCRGAVSHKVDHDMPDPNDNHVRDPVTVLKNDMPSMSSVDCGLQGLVSCVNNASSLSSSDACDESKPPQTKEGNQDAAGSLSDMDNGVSQSVLDSKVYHSSEVRTEVPEVEKPLIGSPSRQDTRCSADATEETQGDDDLGIKRVSVTSDNYSAESPFSHNSLGSSHLDEIAHRHCEEAVHPMSTLEETPEPASDVRYYSSNASHETPDGKADDHVQQPPSDAQVPGFVDTGSHSKSTICYSV